MPKRKIRYLFLVLLITSLMVSQTVFAQDEEAGLNENDYLDYLKSVASMVEGMYNFDITSDVLLDGAIKGLLAGHRDQPVESALEGMFSTMDPFTMYFSDETLKRYNDLINGGQDNADNNIGNTDILKESQEQYQGQKAQDGIVSYKIKDNIGYIKLSIFSLDALSYMDKALKYMDTHKISRIILDLRDNPGGDMQTCASIARKFVTKGLIAKAKFKSELFKEQSFYSNLESRKYDLALLVNGMSASASECLTGAVQDTKAGVVIGTKTYGKAKIQADVPLLKPEVYKKYKEKLGVKVVDALTLNIKYYIPPRDEDILGIAHITVGTYTTPNGRMIDGTGIIPDIAVDDPAQVNGISVGGIQSLAKTAKYSKNSKSSDVYNAEKILKAIGYDMDSPDTVLDAKTVKAVTRFQKDEGLFAYGVLDITTQKLLNDKLEELIARTDKQYHKAVEVLNGK